MGQKKDVWHIVMSSSNRSRSLIDDFPLRLKSTTWLDPYNQSLKKKVALRSSISRF